MRIVLDSNVLLAAFGAGGTCRALLEACLAAHQVCVSEYILLSPRQSVDRLRELARPSGR